MQQQVESAMTQASFGSARLPIFIPISNEFHPGDRAHEVPIAAGILAFIAAEQAIVAKAAALGSLAGAAVATVDNVTGGFEGQFAGCDIYFSNGTGAHEVHGDIRAKYNALHGPDGVLGLPTTDETGTPDGVGRFNHFTGGSIYWTPNTGPMMVRGPIRDFWAGQGWEAGPLGYPVADEYRLATFSPASDPATFWGLFQNGAILRSDDGVAAAVTVELTPEALRRAIWKRFDKSLHLSPDNIGLHPPMETLGVDDWTFGFWKSRPRKATFRLHGFHDNGLAPDTDFELNVRLMFDLAWQPTFTEPSSKTIVVGLDWVQVSAHGLGSQSIADGVANGVHDSFFPKGGPDPSTPDWIPYGWQSVLDIPTGADLHGRNGRIDVLGILLTRDGGLQVLLNPLPTIAGNFRKLVAQQKIDSSFGDG